MIAGIVKDRGVKHHRIGIEERVRFFIADGIRREAAGMEVTDAWFAVTCRMPDDQVEGGNRVDAARQRRDD